MAPDIDGLVYIKCESELERGTMIDVKIIRSIQYDLLGVVCDELGE